MDEPAVENLRHEAIWSSDIWLVAREVILDAFIENADVHLEQAIEALERWRFIGVIPLKYWIIYDFIITKIWEKKSRQTVLKDNLDYLPDEAIRMQW